jgi:hypothetical protein
MKNIHSFEQFSFGVNESDNLPPGAEMDPSAPWNQPDYETERKSDVKQSNLKYKVIASDYTEHAIVEEKGTGKLSVIFFDPSEDDFRDYMEVPYQMVGRDEDGDPEYEYFYDEAEVDDKAIEAFASELPVDKKGKGLDFYESYFNSLTEIDEELAQHLLDEFDSSIRFYMKSNMSQAKKEKMVKMLENMKKVIKDKFNL